VLAPSRFGAHNWEGRKAACLLSVDAQKAPAGLGMLTIHSALEALGELSRRQEAFAKKAPLAAVPITPASVRPFAVCRDVFAIMRPAQTTAFDASLHTLRLPLADISRVVVAGHSMGGHGALIFATHFPDRVLGVAPLAAWIRKEAYGDSNNLFEHDQVPPLPHRQALSSGMADRGAQSNSFMDPTMKSVFEAAVAENYVDLVGTLAHVVRTIRSPTTDRCSATSSVHPCWHASATRHSAAQRPRAMTARACDLLAGRGRAAVVPAQSYAAVGGAGRQSQRRERSTPRSLPAARR
jgi:pimeloyl-ACP methyl ester carboxylesterase